MARYRRMTDPGYESPFISRMPGIPASMEPDREPEYEYKDERLDEKWAEDMVMRIGKARFDREYGGVITLSDPGFEPPERFGQWTVWKEGLHPNVKEQKSDRYLCAVVAIHRVTGLPVCRPFQEVLPVDGNGVFHGLMADNDVYQKVVAWMPLPELPGNSEIDTLKKGDA